MWGAQQQWSQWAIQPSMFNNVPHDEIDWAQLAKEWIQMQNQEPGSQPPPHMSGGGGGPFMPDDYMREQHPLPPQMRDSHHPPPPLPPHSEAFAPDIPGKHPEMSIESAGPFQQTDHGSGGYWRQDWDIRAAAAADIDDRVWVPPVPPPVQVDIPGPPMMHNEKKTFDYGHVNDAPTLAMQTVDYNHTSEHFGYGPPPMPPKKGYMPPPFPMYPGPPPEDMYDQYWSQVAATPMIPATFFKKKPKPVSTSASSSSVSAPVEEESTHIDAAKRKQLPAWIREGLEKMEQERLKRLEKERAEKERLEKAKKTVLLGKDVLGVSSYGDSPTLPAKSKFDSDSEKEEEDEVEEHLQDDKGIVLEEKHNNVKEVVVPFLDLRTEEEKQRDLMLKVRRMLTEILLSVTTEEMVSVAREVYQKALSKGYCSYLQLLKS